MKKANRLIIADPSFEDWAGHHAPYDIAVLKAGNIEEVDVQIWAAKSIDVDVSDYEARISKVYSSSAWGRLFGEKKPIASGFTMLYGRISDELKSPVLKVYQAFTRVITHVLKQVAPPFVKRLISQPHRWMIDFLPPVLFDILKRIYQWTGIENREGKSNALGAITYGLGRITPPFFKRLITQPGIWVKDLAPPFLTKIAKTANEKKFDLLPEAVYPMFLRKSKAQYFETVRAVRKNNLGAGDTVFCHMITGFNFLAWAMVAKFCQAKGVSVKILFRYPVNFVPKNRLDVKIALRIYEQCVKSGLVNYYSDSTLLAEQYRSFLNSPVQTLPIPHLPELHPAGLTGCASRIVVAVLGNARAEKGFCDIVESLKLLDSKGEHDIEFHIQTNNPDEQAAPYINQLRQVRSIKIQTYETALAEKEYGDVLAKCDVVLVPYHAEVYEARTSGVLVEAISAAKIAIVTEGTWLAGELQKNGVGFTVENKSPEGIAAALGHIKKNFQQLNAEALIKAKAYRRMHGGPHFLKCLVGGAKFETSEVPEALIVFPFSDFFEQKTGATIRTGLLCQYLVSKGVQVSVVLPMQNIDRPHSRLEGAQFFRYPELPARSSYWQSSPRKSSLTGENFRSTWYTNRSHGNLHNINFDRALNRALRPNSVVLVDYPFDVVNVKYMTQAYGNRICLTFLDLMGLFGTQEALKSKALEIELKAAGLSDRVVTVAKHESDFLKSLGVDNVLIPNPCVVSNEDPAGGTEKPTGLAILGPFVLFVGSKHLPNINAAIKLKALAKQLADSGAQITVVIAGSCHEPTVETYFLSLGKVDDKTLNYLNRNCLMFVCPLEDGTGASLKTIQAMGYSKIVLGSSDAFRGLSVTSMENCIIDESISNYQYWIEEVMNNAQKYTHIEAAAFRFAGAYDYRKCFKRYIDFINNHEL